MGDLTKNFNRSEFACKCGCGADHIEPRLVMQLQMFRDVTGPLVITSGVRCRKHNAAVGGAPNSAHLSGLAVDVRCETSGLRHKLVDLAMHAGFRRMGIYSGWVHLDLAEGEHPQGVLWLGGSR